MKRSMVVLAAAVLLCVTARAAVPSLVNFQARLSDSNGKAAADGDYQVYVMGGLNAAGYVDTAYVYDPSTDGWAPIAPIPEIKGDHSAAVVGDKIYVMGGYDGSAWVDTAYVYDPSTDGWAPITPIPEIKGIHSAAVVGGNIYVMGGYDGTTYVDTVYAYGAPSQLFLFRKD